MIDNRLHLNVVRFEKASGNSYSIVMAEQREIEKVEVLTALKLAIANLFPEHMKSFVSLKPHKSQCLKAREIFSRRY
jgi:hypothetical protein